MATRVFIVDSRKVPDPDASLSIEQVRQQFTPLFPDLQNAEVQERDEAGEHIVEFLRRVGTKGGVVVHGAAPPQCDYRITLLDGRTFRCYLSKDHQGRDHEVLAG